jgi:putative peptide zinc metalloprotease protein
MRRLPGFDSLPEALVENLGARLEAVRLPAGSVVIREGEYGDCCFFVVAGQVEFTVERKGGSTPIGGRGPGGYFGEMALVLPSGARQATVTALTDVELLSMDRESFRAAANHEPTRAAVDSHVERILAAQFIEQVGAFARTGLAERVELAARVVPHRVDAGAVIVREGEVGDRCFMIRSGAVEVFVTRDGVEHHVGRRGPGALFGEASVVTGSPRNATVRALESCELLELDGAALLEASRTSADVSRELTQLVRLREFPRRAPGIEAHERATPDAEPQTVLKNPAQGTYYRLSPRGRFVWEHLDGHSDLRQITLDYLAAFGVFAPQFVADLISGLARGGFLEVAEVAQDAMHTGSRPSRWRHAALSAGRVLELQWSIRNVDRWVDLAYRNVVRFLFTTLGLLAMLAVSVFGLVAFVIVGRDATQLLSHAHGYLLLFVYPGLVLSVAVHEAGHAFATKAYGRTVLRAGVGWYWFGPVAFVDTSDMWLGTRAQRIVVSLAGPAADLVTAGVVSIVALVVSNLTISAGLWSLTLPLYLGVVLNLSPLLEFDGYHVLTDLVDRPNLRMDALEWVRSTPRLIREPRRAAGHWLELGYGLASLLYIAAMAAITVVFYRLVLQRFVESALPHTAAVALAWAVAFATVLLTASAAIGDLRRAGERRDRLT